MKKTVLCTMIIAMFAVFIFGCGSNNAENNGRNAFKEITGQGKATSAESANSEYDNIGTENAADDTGVASGNDNTGESQALTDGEKSDGTDSESQENGENDKEKSKEPTIIVLDPGHGGIYAGAQYFGRDEKNLTLRMAQYVKEYLEKNYSDVEVYLTREDDCELSSELKTDLEMRAEFAKEKNAAALVSLHFNADEEHDLYGATVYVSRRDNVHENAQKLGECIQTKLVELGIKDDGVLTRKSNDMFDENGEAYDYYAINRHCANRDIVGIIVEHCYMDNGEDTRFIESDEALMRLATADADGIAECFGLEKK